MPAGQASSEGVQKCLEALGSCAPRALHEQLDILDLLEAMTQSWSAVSSTSANSSQSSLYAYAAHLLLRLVMHHELTASQQPWSTELAQVAVMQSALSQLLALTAQPAAMQALLNEPDARSLSQRLMALARASQHWQAVAEAGHALQRLCTLAPEATWIEHPAWACDQPEMPVEAYNEQALSTCTQFGPSQAHAPSSEPISLDHVRDWMRWYDEQQPANVPPVSSGGRDGNLADAVLPNDPVHHQPPPTSSPQTAGGTVEALQPCAKKLLSGGDSNMSGAQPLESGRLQHKRLKVGRHYP